MNREQRICQNCKTRFTIEPEDFAFYEVYTNTANHSPHSTNQSCPNEFETSFAPDRPEIVYCEECYQAEVA